MNKPYVELPISDNGIFRMDRLSEYGFFYSNIIGDLNLCPPALSKFIVGEAKHALDASLLQQMMNNLIQPDDTKIPSLDKITLYVTDTCNLSCLHCWMDAKPNSPSMDIPLNQLLSFIDQAVPLGLKSISIGGGEPLTWRPLPDLLHALSTRNLRVHVGTNGTLLDREMVIRFADMDIRVSISLDSHIESLHDHLRGAQGIFKKAYKAIELLNEFNVVYDLVSCVYKENYAYLQEFLQWCVKSGVKQIKLNPIVVWGRGSNLGDNKLLLDCEDLLSLANLICAVHDISIRPSLPHCVFPLEFIYHRLNKGFCDLQHTISIEPDGHLSVCGPAYRECGVSLGHIGKDVDLAELWTTHPFILNVLRETPRRLTGICRKCVFSRCCFGFCKVLTYGVSNSWLAPYPLCIQLYETQRFPEIYLHDCATEAFQEITS